MATWRKLISCAMKENDETWDDAVMANASLPEHSEDSEPPGLDAEFDSGYGGPEVCKFLVWTSRFVYFPCCYDGSEWAASAPIAPVEGLTQAHIGGY